MEDGAPSRRVVEQRVRNGIIEYLDLVASYDEQAAYETTVPFINVPHEIICGWEDLVATDPRKDATQSDVFSADEVVAICEFHAVWDIAADAVRNDFPRLVDVQALPEWNQLRRAASKAREVFAVRGKVPEDHEIAE